MLPKLYIQISTTFFIFIAFLHYLRLFLGAKIHIVIPAFGFFEIPMWVSWLGTVVFFILVFTGVVCVQKLHKK